MNAIKFSIPETWNQLSDWQFRKVLRLLHKTAPGQVLDKAILKVLLNIRSNADPRNANLNVLLHEVPMSELKSYFEFLYNSNDRTNFIRSIKANGNTWHAPMDRIANLTASEFAAALDLNNKFLKTKDPEYLHYLAAVLYTTKDRPVFDKLKLEPLANMFSKVSDINLIAMHVTFSGCVTHIAKRFPKAFPKTNNKKPSKYGFGKIILQMCRQDLSKHPIISQTNIYTFLEQFEDDIKNAPKK